MCFDVLALLAATKKGYWIKSPVLLVWSMIKLLQIGHDVLMQSSVSDEACCSILYSLQTLSEILLGCVDLG